MSVLDGISFLKIYSDKECLLVDYADLPVIDLSKADTTEGRAELAIQVCKALTSQGFFYVINHGYTPAQVCTIDRTSFRYSQRPFYPSN
jgi:isopenicillin N synthase-like dioxygenase